MLADGCSRPFDEFMEWALYHTATGYYRRNSEEVLGKDGDFFTASQLQPAFGALIAALLPQEPVLELGAGREEMRTALAPRLYQAIGLDDPLPTAWRGTIFANEFFDALPVVAGVRQGTELHELLVEKRSGAAYRWKLGPKLPPERCAYVNRYYPHIPDGARFEIAERTGHWIRRISKCLIAGTVMIIDYGWTGQEYVRFPEGSLMSYRRHAALSDVLANPGQQDITAHVPFDFLMDCAAEQGFTIVRFETLAQTILAALNTAPHLLQSPALRPQLKTLLFGMGDTFRTLILTR